MSTATWWFRYTRAGNLVKRLSSVSFLMLPFEVLNEWSSLCLSPFLEKGIVLIACRFGKRIVYGLPSVK